MTDCPRRTLLRGIGAAAVVGTVGTAPAAADIEDEIPAVADFGPLLEFLPNAVSEETMTVSVTDNGVMKLANDPFRYGTYLPGSYEFDLDPAAIDAAATASSYASETSLFLTVLNEEVELDGETESTTTDAGIEYDRIEPTTDGRRARSDADPAAAIVDGATILASSADLLAAAIDAGAEGTDRLVDERPAVEEGLAVFDDAHTRAVIFYDESPIDVGPDPTFLLTAQSVVDPDTIEQQFGIDFPSESDVTDEVVETITEDFARMRGSGPTVSTDGSLVIVRLIRDLEAEREAREHESPGSLQYDPEALRSEDGDLKLTLGRGDPTPVAELELTLNDEPYEPDVWAAGQDELEAGDTIILEREEIEPNLDVTLHHDQEYVGSASGTTLLSHFDFEFDYDHEAGSVDITYADTFPLDGDRVIVATYDDREQLWRRPDDDFEPTATVEPWTGTELTGGESATIDDIVPGMVVLIGWDGTGPTDSIGRITVSPPGRVSFDYAYAERTASVTLRVEEPQPADAYVLTVDEEPAATQWSDSDETIDEEASLTVEDVEPGTALSVRWAGNDTEMGSWTAYPRIQLAMVDGGTTIEHAGGDAVATSKLTLIGYGGEGDRVELDLDEELEGTFEEGDTVDLDAAVEHVRLQYGERRAIGFAIAEE